MLLHIYVACHLKDFLTVTVNGREKKRKNLPAFEYLGRLSMITHKTQNLKKTLVH